MTWNSINLSLWTRPECQTLKKAFNIPKATTGVATDLLKALAILSDTSVKISSVDPEDLKPYWKSEKNWLISLTPHLSLLN